MLKKDISVYNVLKFAHNTLKKNFSNFTILIYFFTINWSFLFYRNFVCYPTCYDFSGS